MQVGVNFLSSCYSPDAWMVLGSQNYTSLEQTMQHMVNLGNSLQLEIIETNAVATSDKKLYDFTAISTANEVYKGGNQTSHLRA